MAGALPRLELYDALRALGGKRLASGGFVAPSVCSTVRSLEGEETLSFTTPRDSDAGAVVREGYVANLWRSDTDFEEWPVGRVMQTAGADATVSVVARALLYRLGECGLVTQPGVAPMNGLPILDFSVTGTPTELLQAYVTDRDPVDDLADELAWLGLGTIDPTASVTLDVSWWSVLQFVDGIVAALAALGIAAERSLRRTGTSGYVIDVLNEPT